MRYHGGTSAEAAQLLFPPCPPLFVLSQSWPLQNFRRSTVFCKKSVWFCYQTGSWELGVPWSELRMPTMEAVHIQGGNNVHHQLYLRMQLPLQDEQKVCGIAQQHFLQNKMKTNRGSCLKPCTSLKTNKPRLKLFLWNRIEAGPVHRAIQHHGNAWKWHCWFGVSVRPWAVLWEAFSLLCPLEGSKWGKRCRRFFVICVQLSSFGCVLGCFLQICPSCHGAA